MSNIQFINDLNDLYKESRIFELNGWDSSQNSYFNIKIDFNKYEFEILDTLTDNVLARLLWQAGILKISSLKNEEVEKLKDFLDSPNNKAKCIALDSNMILYRFMDNFINQNYNLIDQQFPGIILLPNACQHEFHYKAANTYLTNKQELLKLIEKEPIIGLIICSSKIKDHINRRIETVKNFAGRLGLKGDHEIRKLQENEMFPVIISSPGHLYYSETIQTSDKFIDAIFDSLIRVEINFFRKNTNADIRFLTGDKDQYTAADNEGLSSLWITPPLNWETSLKKDKSLFNLNTLSELIIEFLIYSPYIKIKSGDREHYYTFHWYNKKPTENIEGLIKAYNNKGKTTYLLKI
ncbi:MAG: hypothetical protein ACTSPY_06700 [Candidatus Helarchaeota archaeon]